MIKRSAKFSCNSEAISTDELKQILDAALELGADHVTIHQTRYNEPPYGASITTTIEIEQGPTKISGEGY